MKDQFDIKWIDRGRPPNVEPNRMFPDGMDVDMSVPGKQSCLVKLPYPPIHKNIGVWMVACNKCGLIVAVTAASRPDDPKSVKMPCKS